MSEEEVQPEMIKEMRIDDIMKCLPHRYPFLLVDRMKDIVPGQSAIGIKNLTMNEEFFQGHFPNNPIMPGVLQIEGMAQAAGIIVVSELPKDQWGDMGVYFMTVDEVKFRKPVTPGDVLEYHVVKERSMRNVHKFRGVAKVDGQIVSQSVFSAMVVKKS